MWTLGSCSTIVRGHMVLRHNHEESTIGTKGRIPGGVSIILSPTAVEAWRAAGSKPPITTPLGSSFVGRFIGVKLRHPQINQYEKIVRGNLTLSVASIYQPVDELEQTEFINILSTIMSSVPKKAKFIGGNDVNTNLGVRSKIYGETLGPWGINNRNIKGRRLLGFFSWFWLLLKKPKSLLHLMLRLLISHGPRVSPYILDLTPKLEFTSFPPMNLAFFGTELIMVLRMSMNSVCSSSSTG